MKTAALSLALLAALALPHAASAPGACADPCVVAGYETGYHPIVTVIATGTSVAWESDGYAHVTRDGADGLVDAAACFEVLHAQRDLSPPVRFDLDGATLRATVDGETLDCANAVPTPAGAALPYYCTLHPTMRGLLVVTA